MELKTFIRGVKPYIYPESFTQPDESMSIGEMIERHIGADSVSNHESEAYEDVNIENPMRYDFDLTDVPTKYQDGDYFNYLERMRKGISTDALDNNPKNLSSEKVSTNSTESLPSNSATGKSS